jgi:hypothetical protein
MTALCVTRRCTSILVINGHEQYLNSQLLPSNRSFSRGPVVLRRRRLPSPLRCRVHSVWFYFFVRDVNTSDKDKLKQY